MNEHPSLERILDRALERARAESDAAEANDLTAHIDGCEPCREAERWVRRLVDSIGDGPPRKTPESLIDRALGIPSEEPREQPEAGGWSIARLVEDAFAKPALAGVRGTATARRMLFELEGGHVDVEIAPAEDDEQFKLRGQVIFDDRPPPDDLLALLWSERRAISRASGDAAGVFVFSGVQAGLYRLDVLSLSARRAVRVAEITVEVEES